MKTTLWAMGLLLSLSAVGCTDVSNTGDYTYFTYDIAPADMAPDMVGGMPAPPTPGIQYDRAGRPLISKLLVNPFTLTTTQLAAGTGADNSQAKMQDTYNANKDPATWQTAFAAGPWIMDALAAWDGIDGNCNNQYNPGGGATKYQNLAQLFANDFLVIDTTKNVCNRYLAVELGDTVNCGGRQPSITGLTPAGAANVPANVVDTTMNLLLGGFPTAAPVNTMSMNVPNNQDGDGQSVIVNTAVPFLLPPT